MIVIAVLAGLAGLIIGVEFALWVSTCIVRKSNDIGNSGAKLSYFGAKVNLIEKRDEGVHANFTEGQRRYSWEAELRKRRKELMGDVDDDPDDEDSREYWYCPKCRHRNTGHSCTECGEPKTLRRK
jgi:hypothetical protein